ncbi:hypothetical protein [Mesorhizobium sp. M0244]|uniref:hypothetical protein n=1 Tax=Mesorhizobium sp. M0244 TaxID=2956926 RepID=UPI00333980BA
MDKSGRTSNLEEQLTRGAMADVDVGRVIDHRLVQAWASSLGTSHPLQVPRWEQDSSADLSTFGNLPLAIKPASA